MTSRSMTARVQRRRPDSRSGPPGLPLGWLLGGLALLIAAAAVVAAVVGSSPDTPSGGAAEPAAQSVAVVGEPLPPLPESGVDPAAGQPLPTLRGVDFEGAPSVIDPSDGKTKLVLALAHWCPHCQAEVPSLVAWLRENPLPNNVEMVAVATAIDPARPNYPPSAWLAREDWPGQVPVDDAESSALAALGLNSFPGWVLVDENGGVVRRLTGELGTAAYPSLIAELQ